MTIGTEWGWLDRGLAPRAVAVYGASDRSPGAGGSRVGDNLMRHGYEDRIVFVNPRPQEIHGVKSVASAVDSPLADEIDFAFIAVPRAGVEAAVEDCARAGIKLATVVTAGFGEIDDKGLEDEQRLREIAQANGMRLFGPNCMGLINVRDSLFAARPPFDDCASGAVSVVAQSGTVACRLMEEVSSFGQGIDLWVTMGNCMDITVPEMITYLAQRDSTKVIVTYLEGIPDPSALREAFKAARAAGKEVVILKPGRTERGSRAIASHTGALASPDVFVDAMVRECDVIRCRTVIEAAQAAGLLLSIGRIRGRVAVIAGSGGDAALVSDLCEENGVPLSALHADTVEQIRAIAPEAGLANPIDPTATVTQKGLTGELDRLIAADPDVSCIVVLGGAAFRFPDWRPEWIESTIDRYHVLAKMIPVVHASPMGRNYRERLSASSIGVMNDDETAWRALGAVVDLDPESTAPEVKACPSEHAPTDEAAAASSQALPELEAMGMLGAAGIPMIESVVIGSEKELRDTAQRLGYPLVMKGLVPGITHKTDRNLVQIGIRDEAVLVATWNRLHAEVGDEGKVVLQPEIQGKVAELIVGAVNDPRFGVHLMLGAGGTWAELEGKRSWRHGVVSAEEAREMIASLPLGQALIEGRRGVKADVDAVVAALQRLSEFAVDNADSILEVEINPLIVRSGDAVGVDGLIRINH